MAKHSKHKAKQASKPLSDMKEILSDPRFSHVSTDPKYRSVSRKKYKVKLDSRFASVLTDDRFYEKSIMDSRGRRGNFSTKEDLMKFYHLSSEEEEQDDDDDDDDASLSDEAVGLPSEATQEQMLKEDVSGRTVEEFFADMSQDCARGAVLFPLDSSDDDSTTTEEDIFNEEFDWGEVDLDAKWDVDGEEVEETSRFAVCNMDWDRVKAADLMVLLSSFIPSSGGHVKKVSIYPSEFGKGRIAEEDAVGPKELVDLSHNRNLLDKEIKDLENLEKGKLSNKDDFATSHELEVLRKYQRNRLRYYYAVVECDSVETSRSVYVACDRQQYEAAGVMLDLRYIPSDMEFDEVPHDTCEKMPSSYVARAFTTQALHDTRPVLTWDETNEDRRHLLTDVMKKVVKGHKYDEEALQAFVATSSSSDESGESDAELQDGGVGFKETDEERIRKFKSLINEINEKENKKREENVHMEEQYEVVCQKAAEEEEEEEKDEADMSLDERKNDSCAPQTPFEKYLEKRKHKRKQKKLAKKQAAMADDAQEEDEEDSDDVPDFVRDDPLYRKAANGKNKARREEGLLSSENTADAADDLDLLLMDEEQEHKEHFNMRNIIKAHKLEGKKKKRKAERIIVEMKQAAKVVDDFKVNTEDDRFRGLWSSSDYSIDPSHPGFKKTRALDDLLACISSKRKQADEAVPDSADVKHEIESLVKRVKKKLS